MRRYAEGTSVSVEKSKAEIEKTLQRYGAQGFAYGWQNNFAMIRFVMEGRQIRFLLPLPDRGSREFLYTPARGRMRSCEEALAAWEQACRQKWRALALAIKAKLESVEAGIASFEDEFLAHIMLPDGTTAGEWMKPQIAKAYEIGSMPPLLGYGS